MTIPAKTFLLECCEWPSMRAENRSITSLPIRSATDWGKENSDIGMLVPEKRRKVKLSYPKMNLFYKSRVVVHNCKAFGYRIALPSEGYLD